MRKREVMLALLVALVFLSGSIESQTVGTALEVIYGNIPPILTSNIPDQTWATNQNRTDAFDLDDYFIDNETITYTASSVENITVIINETTNIVSFYPNYTFSGIRNVTFTAYDGYTTSSSNLVTLNVTPDTSPPQWTSPTISATNIFQNSQVIFTTTWTDNFGLSYYIFSLNQLGSWVNYTNTSFSGTENVSSASIQIAAPGGSTGYWRFFAFDQSGNMNASAVQNFSVNSTATTSTTSAASTSSSEDTSSTDTAPTPQVTKRLDFIIEPSDSYGLEMRQGESGTITFKITNTGNTDLEFELDFEGLEEFLKALSITSFNLTAGESRTVTAEFTSPEKLTPDIYYGKIRVNTKIGEREILIAIVVKKFITDLELKVEVPEEYKTVRLGNKVRANITIESTRDFKERNISLYYAVNSFTGKVINSAHDQFTMKSQKLVIEKELEIPEDNYIGKYIFFARAVTDGDIAIDSDTFEVGEKFSVQALVRSNLILILIILLSALIAYLMLRRHKNKERMRLLNLYMMVTELNKLMKDGKTEEAIDLYVRIKSVYSEPVSKTAIKNRDDLKKEMQKLSEELNMKIFSKQEIKEAQKEVKVEVKKAEGEKEPNSAEPKKESEEKENKEEQKTEEKK